MRNPKATPGLRGPLTATGGRDPRRRGGVLALAMMAVLAAATLSASMLQLSSAMTRRQLSNTNLKLAFYTAEAGLAEAYQGVSIGKTGNVGTGEAPARFGNGLFWVEATHHEDGTVTLRSTGMVGNGSAELSMVVEPRLASVASLGLFADEGLQLGPGASVDGYDSGAGEYELSLAGADPLPGVSVSTGGVLGGLEEDLESSTGIGVTDHAPEPQGKLGSNQDVTLTGTRSSPVVVDGDAQPGPEHLVITSDHATVTGSTAPAELPTALPAVTAPSFPPSSGVDHAGAVPHVFLPGQRQLPYLRAAPSAQLVIQGPATLVVDRLQLELGSQLYFDTTGGTIHLYVLSELDWQPGSEVVTSGEKAWELTIQVPGELEQPARLAASGELYGIVYAPQAALEVDASLEIFGTLVGETIDLRGPVRVHFDRHLEEIAEELALPRTVSWRIVELSNPLGLTQVMDPFRFLGVTRDSLEDPADAHADQQLTVTYEVLPGVRETYSGPESAFDWRPVILVHSITRDGVRVAPDGGGLAEVTSDMLGG